MERSIQQRCKSFLGISIKSSSSGPDVSTKHCRNIKRAVSNGSAEGRSRIHRCSSIGVSPGERLDNGSRVNREVYARFCERLRVRFPGSTHQQSYTDLVRYVILLHRIRDGYVTLLDVFHTVISAGTLEKLLIETGRTFTSVSFLGVDKAEYLQWEPVLHTFEFSWNACLNQY